MAGNIIPAIATTNAMFASLAVLESYKVLRALRGLAPWTDASMVFSNDNGTEAITKERRPGGPNPHCLVCGVARQQLAVNSDTATVQHLLDLLDTQFQYDADGVTIYNDKSEVVYDPDLTDNAARLLTEVGMGTGAFVTIEDGAFENPRVNLVFSVCEAYASLPCGHLFCC
jgi:ubiquitin-like 1-activating enzyme E1 B